MISVNIIHTQADLAQRNQERDKFTREIGELCDQVTKLKSAVDERETRKTELEQSLEKTSKECNHWKQKSVHQGIVIQDTQKVYKWHAIGSSWTLTPFQDLCTI